MQYFLDITLSKLQDFVFDTKKKKKKQAINEF